MRNSLDYAEPAWDAAPVAPLRELLSLALPTVAQMASYTLMQFIDTLMLAQVGNGIIAPTAAANSGILAFSVISLGMGVLWVVNTLVSQAFGRKDYAECGRYLWQGVWFAAGFGLFLLPVLPFVPTVFTSLGHSPDLVQLEVVYLRIVMGGSVVRLIGTAFAQFMLAIGRPLAVMSASFLGVSVNAVAAYVMVFGRFGVQPMGVVGAAWAQVMGMGVEMLALILLANRRSIRRMFNVADWMPRLPELKLLLKVGIPSGFQIVTDVLAWSAFSMWVMGVFGTGAMAANTFVFRYMSLSFMPAFGLSSAVTALVGRYIGRGEPETAVRRANLGFVVAGTYMVACGLFFYLGRHVLIGLFAKDPDVAKLGALLLIFAGAFQFFDAMYIIYNGALRGAGDTLVPAIVTGVMCWAMVVFGGYAIARIWTPFGATGPWYIALAYGILLGIFMLLRFRGGVWRSIRLEAGESADTVRNFDAVSVETGR